MPRPKLTKPDSPSPAQCPSKSKTHADDRKADVRVVHNVKK